MQKILEFLKEHAAFLSGAGFLLLAAYKWTQNDLPGAGHDAMLALAAFGIKFGVEKLWNGLPEDPTQPAAK